MDFSLYSFEFESSKGKVLVFADPHLAFEPFRGVQIRSRLESKLAEYILSVDPDVLIILGDVKEELGISKYTQRILLEFFSKIRDIEVIITKGNHDGKIEEVTGKFENIEVVDYYILDDILFIHGHRDLPEDRDFKRAFLGHVHPTALIDFGGVKRKVKCFVKVGKFIIFPTINPYLEGIRVNEGINMIPFLKNVKEVSLILPPGIYIDKYFI
ncbi:metallophosphoesterase [Pyrococcus sp. ST04]|uniref:metallophosphoesterase n=1 Tax=Pyrococcus sp. ST04 TaxID=1183377 RepID=UPI0002605F81|nr:metallophosphoesterase [Pyrococcus sp. ST04]AFK22688.1 putative Exonuclease SbcD like protein [Pyrococcus sp. ST04]